MAAAKKRIALTDYIELDNVSFSNGEVRSITFSSEDEQVPAGGFNADGETEILAGLRTKSVTLEVYPGRISGGIFQVLYPLHRDRTVFDFEWRADQNAGVSATNPALRGSVKMPTFPLAATFGEVETTTITLVSDQSDGLEFYET